MTHLCSFNYSLHSYLSFLESFTSVYKCVKISLILKKNKTKSQHQCPKQTILAPLTLGCQMSENAFHQLPNSFLYLKASFQEHQEPRIPNCNDFYSCLISLILLTYCVLLTTSSFFTLFSPLLFSYEALFRFFFLLFPAALMPEIRFSRLFPQMLIFLFNHHLSFAGI